MSQGRPLDDTQRERILALARSGESRNAVAREVGVSTSTVSRVARTASLTFDRRRTEAATRARQVDLRAERAELEADLLGDAARMRRQLWQPHTLTEFSAKDREFYDHRLPEPPPHDKLALAKATGVLVDRSVKLALVDDDNGVEDARGMLTRLSEELHFVYTHTEWTETEPES